MRTHALPILAGLALAVAGLGTPAAAAPVNSWPQYGQISQGSSPLWDRVCNDDIVGSVAYPDPDSLDVFGA